MFLTQCSCGHVLNVPVSHRHRVEDDFGGFETAAAEDAEAALSVNVAAMFPDAEVEPERPHPKPERADLFD